MPEWERVAASLSAGNGLVVADGRVDPECQAFVCGDGVGGDGDPAGTHASPGAHLGLGGTGLGKKPAVLGCVNTNQQVTGFSCADDHLAVHHDGAPAEHGNLSHVRLVGQQSLNALDKAFLVGCHVLRRLRVRRINGRKSGRFRR